jgi:hypothetical protein
MVRRILWVCALAFLGAAAAPALAAQCGDNLCQENEGENCSNCEQDCGRCPECFNGECEHGETCDSCPEDCGYQCRTCSDFICDWPWESCDSCPWDCCPGDFCMRDWECPRYPWEVCRNNYCVYGEQCTDGAFECRSDETCEDGRCVPLR